MKKLVTLVLTVCLCLSAALALSSCDKKGDATTTPAPGTTTPAPGATTTDSGASVPSEEVWNSSIEMDNFDNVTFLMAGTFDTGETFEELVKLDGNTCLVEEEVSNDPEMVNAIKTVYVATVLGVMNNFDNFTFDSAEGVFKSNVAIVYDVNVLGEDCTITANNVVVTIDTANKLATMNCDMKQVFDGGELNMTVTFTFSDYGTTVIE